MFFLTAIFLVAALLAAKEQVPVSATIVPPRTLHVLKRIGGHMIPYSPPLIIAHRGDSKHAPENTRPAFELALKYRPDMVEGDYHHSKDGEFIVIHDHHLDRTTDAVKKWGPGISDILVSSRTLKEIKTLDAGSWFHWNNSEFTGTKVPTLKEALDVIQKSSVALIERKEGKPEDLMRFLRNEGLTNDVAVHSFDWDFIEELGTFSDAPSRGAIGPPWGKYKGRVLTESEKWLNAEFIEDIASRGAQFFGWNSWVTAESVALAHSKGLRVFIYTIDDPNEAQRLVALGVDGITTNDPELMAKRLRQ